MLQLEPFMASQDSLNPLYSFQSHPHSSLIFYLLPRTLGSHLLDFFPHLVLFRDLYLGCLFYTEYYSLPYLFLLRPFTWVTSEFSQDIPKF